MATSPIDGRYRKVAGEKLAPYMSEFGLIKYRLCAMIEYFLELSWHDDVPFRRLTSEEVKILRSLERPKLGDAKIVKAIETEGFGPYKKNKHDVQACELYLRFMLQETSLADALEWLHFGRTSEDVNNLAYALMLGNVIDIIIVPELWRIRNRLLAFARQYPDLSMLSRTHGQSASPTTLGKEFRVFASRLTRQIKQLQHSTILVKQNGASGNENAASAALPMVDWTAFTKYFIGRLNLKRKGVRFEVNQQTTQIEPHDTYAELFGIICRINTILIDCCQDIWRYISDGWLSQVPAEGETGSSTMPHKVNPIDFENAEGSLEIANAMFELFERKLPRSRLQRDLSDSTVERSFGEAFGRCLVAYASILRGLGKISPNKEAITSALSEHPYVIAEAYQTILRREGYPNAYQIIKDLTRGRSPSLEGMRTFVRELDVPESVKKEMLSITPENYIGLAPLLAKM